MAAGRKSSNVGPAMELAQVLFFIFLIIVLPAVLGGYVAKKYVFSYFAARTERQNRVAEDKLQRGTSAAYEGTARVDVELARKAIAKGDLEAGEERAFRAKAKLEAPQAADKTGQAASELQGLEIKHGESFKPIRRRKER